MTNENLLKEAIADAKAVKETAIANAKLALEEAFTPHLKSMLSAKLQEMDKDEEIEEEVELEEMDAVSFKEKNGESMDAVPHKVGQTTVQEEEEMDEEINLEELLAELELEENARTDAEEEGYLDGMKDEKEDLKEDERTDAEEEGYLDGMEDEKEDNEDKMEDEEIDLEDMSEDDLKSFIEDVISDMVKAGELEAGEAAEDDEDMDVEDEDVEDVNIEIDEMSNPVMRKGEKGDDEIEKETEKMRFKEAIDEINSLKIELQEVNLLNAKLLYTNKIFKAKNLSEDKKVKVLKAFDKAESVKEAKIIYETLNEGLVSKFTTPMINEVKGSASKATGIISEVKKPIIESNDVYDRMRKLAGLI
jgi:hypothetical protein